MKLQILHEIWVYDDEEDETDSKGGYRGMKHIDGIWRGVNPPPTPIIDESCTLSWCRWGGGGRYNADCYGAYDNERYNHIASNDLKWYIQLFQARYASSSGLLE